MFIQMEKCPFPIREYLAKSAEYVRGEIVEMYPAQSGICSMGMKTPLINISGRRIRFDNIIILEGLSVGGVERSVPRAEKQAELKMILIKRRSGDCTETLNTSKPSKRGTMEIINPKMKPANISPSIIEVMEAGVETSLSRVFILVSHGVIIGLADEVVKNSVMPIRPGNRTSNGIFLPMEKARKSVRGKNKPNIKTGALK